MRFAVCYAFCQGQHPVKKCWANTILLSQAVACFDLSSSKICTIGEVGRTTLVCPTILSIPTRRRLPNVGRTYWNAFFHESLLQWFGLLALGLRWPSHLRTTEWWRVHLFSHFEECSLVVKFLGMSWNISALYNARKSALF
jgi:hypothetical protein